jgi:hypothetical protein
VPLVEPLSRRAAIGFFVAPLVVALSVGVLTPADPGSVAAQVLGFFVLVLVWYVYACIFTAVFAVPAFLILRHFNLVRWWSTLAGGMVIGSLAGAVIGEPTAVMLRGVFPIAVLGGISGFVFWLIWRAPDVA